MTLSDFIFVMLVLGLPIAVSLWLFRSEPVGRPFLATYVLALIGTSLLFAIAAFALMFASVGGVGPFDGIFAVIAGVPIALVVGLIVRRHRHRIAL